MRRSIILVFAVALLARTIVSLLQISYGVQPIPGLFVVTPWGDFHGLYVQQLSNLGQGLVPYRDFAYSYTPLFLYVLYPFYALGGSNTAAIPIVAADILTAVMVFLLVQKHASSRIAFVAGLGYALSPLALFEVGYLWLSSQPMAFLMLLAIYLLKEDRPVLAWATLAVATLVKQESVFLLPVFFLKGITIDWRKLSKPVALFALITFAVSIPFLILSWTNYLSSVSYGLFPIEATKVSNATTSASVTPTLTWETLTITYPNPPLAATISFIGWLSPSASVVLLVLLIPALYVSRHKSNFDELASSYTTVFFLFLFSSLVHIVLRYYLIPSWAFLYASARTRLASVISIVGGAMTMLSPQGAFQLVLPLATILAVIALTDGGNESSVVSLAKKSVRFLPRHPPLARTSEANQECATTPFEP